MSAEIPNVLLSIEPEHAEAILDGEKQWEYRRVVPAADPPLRYVLYANNPVQAAVGACWVPYVRSGSPATVVTRTIHETPNDADDVLDYFDGADQGHALRVMGPRRFDSPLDRRSLEAAGIAPAQNFRYLPEIDPSYAEQAGVTL